MADADADAHADADADAGDRLGGVPEHFTAKVEVALCKLCGSLWHS